MDCELAWGQKGYVKADDVMERCCPLCDSGAHLEIYREKGPIRIVRCGGCGLIYANPILKEPGKNYWGDERCYYEEAKLLFNGSARHHRDPNYLQDLRIIERLKPEGNFLDVGTNMGFFLRHTAGRKWNVFGVEPSPSLSEMARKYFGLNVMTAYLAEAGFQDEFFDVVTMIDVFEHIVEPKGMLRDIRKVLKKDGILFIKVPNGNYNLLKLWMAKMTGNLGAYDIFDSHEHITHFTHATLNRILEDSGFRVDRVFIGRPIQVPVWYKYVGRYYQYPSPWAMDAKNYILRRVFYWISKAEFLLRLGNAGYFAPNIITVAVKN